MSTINLVTGGAGFIGSHLIDKLIEKNEKVICLDDLSSGCLSNLTKAKSFNKFSFINQNVIKTLDLKVDRIWHFGSLASEKDYSKDPIKTMKNLFLGSINLLDLAKHNNASILLASSSEIYGQCSLQSQDEKFFGNVNCFSKRAAYSEGKRISETLFYNYHKMYGVDIRIARIFNTYGPRLSNKDGRVIGTFINNIISNKLINIFGDGSQTRSFCYVDDMVKGLMSLMTSNFRYPINLGNNSEISILDLAILISKKIGNKVDFKFLEPKENEPYKRIPSIELAKNKLGWEPKVSLDEGLEMTIKYFLDKKRKLMLN